MGREKEILEADWEAKKVECLLAMLTLQDLQMRLESPHDYLTCAIHHL